MIAKAKEMLVSTICNGIENLVKSHINLRLSQIPRSISVSQILKFLTLSKKSEKNDSKSKYIFNQNVLNIFF